MKKGFTLVELLATIVILGILTIVVLPDIIDVFHKSSTTSMKVQENQLSDAANLYFTDYCSNPIDSNSNCRISQSNERYYDDVFNGNRPYYLCSSVLRAKGYISDIYYDKDNLCDGFILYDYDSYTDSYKQIQTYIACGSYGNKYFTNGDYTKLIKYCGTEVYYSDGKFPTNSGSSGSGYSCYNCY